MKITFTRSLTALIVFMCFAGSAFAQIPTTSPYTVIFRVDNPSTIDGEYPYGAPVDWGDTLINSVSGQAVWAYGPDTTNMNAPDSCVCGPVVNDVAGKIAVIRRGTCTFGAKIWHAMQAGAIGVVILNHFTTATDAATTIYNMSLPNVEPFQTLCVDVNIPGVFLSREVGSTIVEQLDAGQTVNMTLYVPRFFDGTGLLAYATPEDMVQPIGPFSASILNLENVPAPNAEVKVEIIDPLGVVTTFTTSAEIAANADTTLTINEDYLPIEKGDYQIIYSNTVNQDSIIRDFKITDYTYALDNDKMPYDYTSISAGTFDTTAFLNFDVGSYYLGGLSGGTATHVTFGLNNPTDFPVGDIFFVSVFDVDPDDDDALPTGASYADFTTLGEGTYAITGNEVAGDLLQVELDEPVNFGNNEDILVMVRYNGVEAATGIPPQYLSTVKYLTYAGINTMVFTDQLYTDGWSTGDNNIVRLHLEGFVTGTEPVLEKEQVNLFPTPADEELNVEIHLNEVSAKVNMIISDVSGNLIRTESLSNFKEGVNRVKVKDLASGTYFMTIITDEGYRTKSFIVAH
jgi:hypothetical protein